MKNLFLRLMAVFSLFFVVTACGSSDSDPEIERQLDGTWTTTMTESDYEDGELIMMQMKMTVTFDSRSHIMDMKVTASMTNPLHIKMATLTGSGTWSADSETLTQRMDGHTVDFDWHTGLISKKERREFEKEMIGEIDGEENLEIRSITEDKFVVFDGEDEIVFKRKK